MAKKNTAQKMKELQERERKLKEEIKAARLQMQKEEREERRRCYMEVGKIVESCIGRNFREEDVETFSLYAMEHELEIKSCFRDEEEDMSESEGFEEDDMIDEDEIDEDEPEVQDDVQNEGENQDKNLPFYGS